MNQVKRLLCCAAFGVVVTTPFFVGCTKQQDTHHHSTAGQPDKNDFERGPHGGRLLRDEAFSVELTIFETGVSPRFRAYGFVNDKPLAPEEFTSQIQLTRLGGRVERFDLTPTGDCHSSTQEVKEPHSFDVVVNATYQGATHTWTYSSPEAQTVIPQAIADTSEIVVKRATSQSIRSTLQLRGTIFPSEHRIAHIIPRFSGVVREGRKHIGDPVQKGEVLAVIESNQSLQPFEVRSQIAGAVINGHLIVGEFVPENQWVFVVADLSEVWADFYLPLQERGHAQVGQEVVIHPAAGGDPVSGTVSYIAPYADERSQSQLIRVAISNPRGILLPGMFVVGELIVARTTPAVVIERTALQRFGDQTVVFVRYGDTYEARPVVLGQEDGDFVEVKEGLLADEEYVTANSFLVKADILKSGASHDH
jgi:cobalt-zinc-cadmium efflux system membrane fusion protein